MIISVRVQPNSTQKKVEKLEDGSFKVYINSVPENNKANKELIGMLAEEFGVKRYDIEIIKGLTNKED